jgi:hypothetical protein
MPFCEKCGTEHDAGAKFCAKCGFAFSPQAEAGPQPGTANPVELITPRIRTGVPDFVKQALHPSEEIFAAYSASLIDHRRPSGEAAIRHDKFALTNERIIYYHTSLIHKGMGEMSYKMITGVSYNKGWLHGKVIVEAADAGLTMDGIGNDDAAFAEKIISGCIAGHNFRLAK